MSLIAMSVRCGGTNLLTAITTVSAVAVVTQLHLRKTQQALSTPADRQPLQTRLNNGRGADGEPSIQVWALSGAVLGQGAAGSVAVVVVQHRRKCASPLPGVRS